VAAVLVLNTPDDGRLRPKHVEWPCRNKTFTVLHQVGVSFELKILSSRTFLPFRQNRYVLLQCPTRTVQRRIATSLNTGDHKENCLYCCFRFILSPYGLDGPGSNPGSGKTVRPGFGTHPATYSIGIEGLFYVKRPQPSAAPWPPTRTEVNNKCSYTATPPFIPPWYGQGIRGYGIRVGAFSKFNLYTSVYYNGQGRNKDRWRYAQRELGWGSRSPSHL
jgi:hypothetical protein